MAFLILISVLFFYYKKKIKKELLLILAMVIYLVLFQSLFFGGGSLFTTITMTNFLVIAPFFAIIFIGPSFLRYYRDVMVVIAIISTGFWIAVNLSPALHSMSQGWAQAIGVIVRPETGMFNDNYIIYTWENMQFYGLYRNPGPFHEPGAFAVFLMLAIISEVFITRKLITRNNLFFFFNMVTTFSTAGFIGLFIITGFYVLTSKRMTSLTKFFVSGSMFVLIVYLFFTLEFLGEKINTQLEDQGNQRLNTSTVGRFLGARKAIIVLYRYPLFGRGLIAASKAKSTSEEAAGYGWIMWVSQIGVLFGILYMYMIYKALKNYSIVNLHNRLFALFAFIAMLAVLAGQKHTNSWVFFMLVLVPIAFPLRTKAKDYLLNDPSSKTKMKKRKVLSFTQTDKILRDK